METKEFAIEVPDGYEIDIENTDLKTGKVKLKPIKEELYWDEFGVVNGYYIDSYGSIHRLPEKFGEESSEKNANTYPTLELAISGLALCQLLQWRNKFWGENDNWSPDWKSSSIKKHCISINKDKIVFETLVSSNRILCFPNRSVAEKFLKQHRELIEKAKPLL